MRVVGVGEVRRTNPDTTYERSFYLPPERSNLVATSGSKIQSRPNLRPCCCPTTGWGLRCTAAALGVMKRRCRVGLPRVHTIWSWRVLASHVFLPSHLFVFSKYLQVGTSRASLAENFCCSALAHVCRHGLGLSFSGETSFV